MFISKILTLLFEKFPELPIKNDIRYFLAFNRYMPHFISDMSPLKGYFANYTIKKGDVIVDAGAFTGDYTILAAKKVGKLLDSKLKDVGRTGMIFEGFGVDHIHAKLFPMHGTRLKGWQPIKSNVDKYFEKYEGYISSHDYKRANDDNLKKLAKKIIG